MPHVSQITFVATSLKELVEALYISKQISRAARLRFERLLRSRRRIREIATALYGPSHEIPIPGEPGTVLTLLSLRSMGSGRFNLLVFRSTKSRSRQQFKCLVGHRFTPAIESRFRWNLRELFGLFGVIEDYSGFDGAAVNIIDDLRDKICRHDFCLFDNLDTTKPMRPNVYIEAGMAFALHRPFIFCHYRREVWPSDFSNVVYISYSNYEMLFRRLYSVLPLFLAAHVGKRRRSPYR